MKILLISDDEKVFEVTKKITKNWLELIWCRYADLKNNQYPLADIVIIEFDKTKLEGKILQIIKIKSEMGECIPILAIIKGTVQEIFSILKVGAYDYITTIENREIYKEKIEDIVRWNWYKKKYMRRSGV